jgi:hypothetical protein
MRGDQFTGKFNELGGQMLGRRHHHLCKSVNQRAGAGNDRLALRDRGACRQRGMVGHRHGCRRPLNNRLGRWCGKCFHGHGCLLPVRPPGVGGRAAALGKKGVGKYVVTRFDCVAGGALVFKGLLILLGCPALKRGLGSYMGFPCCRSRCFGGHGSGFGARGQQLAVTGGIAIPRRDACGDAAGGRVFLREA